MSNLWSRRSLLRNAERHAHAFAGELPVAPALELAAVLPEPPVRGSDERVEGTILHVWHVPNGIGLEAWVYSDREEALEAVGLRE